jgi:hypothetical protein
MKNEMIGMTTLANGVAIPLLTVLLAACGGGSMMTPSIPPPVVAGSDFAFVANTKSNTVSEFVLDSTSGMLFPIGAIATGSAPEFIG